MHNTFFSCEHVVELYERISLLGDVPNLHRPSNMRWRPGRVSCLVVNGGENSSFMIFFFFCFR